MMTINRLRTNLDRRADRTTLLALLSGLALLPAVFGAGAQGALLVVLPCLALAAGGLLLRWLNEQPPADLLFVLLLVFQAGGLALLPAQGEAVSWALLAGLAAVTGLLMPAGLPARALPLAAALPLAGALAGALLGLTGGLPLSTILLPPLLLAGTGLALLLYGPVRPEAAAPPVDVVLEGGLPLTELAMRMRVTVEELVSAIQAINDVTAQQSDGAAEQATVIRMTSDHLDEFLKLTDRIMEQALSVTQTAQTAADISGRGQDAIRQAIDGMSDIREQVTAIGDTILTLARLTQRVDEIITSVSEIATQSNLLALNASIEAARAGVHGRGFAVVADEVRVLAQQSTSSAQQVRDILVEIQRAMRQTIQATQIGMEGVDVGAMRTAEANDVMIQLSQTVTASHRAVQDISSVIRQQAEGMEEIAISMDRIDRITQQNLGSTRTVEMVSLNLNRLASDLQRVMGESQHLEPDTR